MQKKNIFSIGEIANLTGVTIRTLQYYDNIGLVPLKKEDTNGRRFYQESDLTKLQQVLFYKSLGLPIKDIKDLVIEAVTTEQITYVLKNQRDIFYHKLNDIRANISFIDASLSSIKEKKAPPMGELVQLMISLNKDSIYEYKDIAYDESTKDTFMNYYESSKEIIEIYWDWKSLILEAVSNILNSFDPASDQGQSFAKKWVNMVSKTTKGNDELIEAHKTSYENRHQWPEDDRRLMEFADEFIDKAVDIYLCNLNNENQGGKND